MNPTINTQKDTEDCRLQTMTTVIILLDVTGEWKNQAEGESQCNWEKGRLSGTMDSIIWGCHGAAFWAPVVPEQTYSYKATSQDFSI